MSTEGRRAGGRNRNRNRKDKKHDDMAGLACSGLLEEAFYAWWVGGNGACEKSHRLRWFFRFHGFVRSNELAVIAAADNRAACDRGVWASFFCGLLIFFFLKGGRRFQFPRVRSFFFFCLCSAGPLVERWLAGRGWLAVCSGSIEPVCFFSVLWWWRLATAWSDWLRGGIDGRCLPRACTSDCELSGQSLSAKCPRLWRTVMGSSLS